MNYLLLILMTIISVPETDKQENDYYDYEMEFFPSENCDEID